MSHIYLIISFNQNGYNSSELSFPIAFETEAEAQTYCLEHNDKKDGLTYVPRKVFLGKMPEPKRLSK